MQFLELDDFIFQCESKGMSHRTIKSYRNNTALFLKYISDELEITRINQIRHIHINSYLRDKSQQGLTNRYLNGIIKTLRAFFKFCYEEEYISLNPMHKVGFARPEKKEIEVFSDDEVMKMIKSQEGFTYLPIRNQTILALMADTGIRCTECLDLTHDDIQGDRIRVDGKGNKERFVPLSMRLRKYLRRYEQMKQIYFMHKIDEVDQNYFLSRTGRRLTIEAVERIFKIAGNEVGVRKSIRCSPHTMRHYYAIKMLEQNDIYTVSKLLGHSSTKITEIYLQALTNKKIVEKGGITSPLMMIR